MVKLMTRAAISDTQPVLLRTNATLFSTSALALSRKKWFCTNCFNVILLLLGGACKIAHYSFGGTEQPQMIALLQSLPCVGDSWSKGGHVPVLDYNKVVSYWWLTKSNSTGKSSIVNWSACLYNALYSQLIKIHQAARNPQHS